MSEIVKPIELGEVKPLAYPTEQYKIDNAFKLGRQHAQYEFNDEPHDPDFAFYQHSWASNPYTIERPSVHYAWAAGFCEEWAKLNG